MSDRRRYPRIDAHVVWRSAGLHVPRHPLVDMSQGGMLVYSDEAVPVGARLEIEVLVPDEPTIELHARVVRADLLPPGAPACFDVALKFLDVPEEARGRLAARLGRGFESQTPIVNLGAERRSEARVDDHQGGEVDEIEQRHGGEGLLQAPPGVALAGGPQGDGHVREQDRDQEDLLHALAPHCKAQTVAPHNGHGHDDGAAPDRLRVLFVTPYLPSPPRFGGQRRLHGLIEGLAASHEVSVLSLVDPSEEQSESIRVTEAYCRRVVTVPNHHFAAGPARKRLLQLGSLLSPRSYEWLVHRPADFDGALELQLAKERYDVVHFEFPHMATYRTRAIRARAAGPAFLLDEHNIEYDLARQEAGPDQGALRRAYNAINGRKVHTEEREVWSRFDGCTLTSAHDQGMLLADAPGTRTAIVPNGVDLGFFRPGITPTTPAPTTLLFFGAIDYFPNTDAMLFFTRDVLPKLAERVPRVRLCILGRRPPEAITALRSADVEVAGAVEDVRPYLDRAAVVIVPLRMGGGTRLKILEALAMGKAVVSTSLGAEGLDVVPGRDLLIADDPETFAAAIRRLLDDPDLARRMGAAGRRAVEARYGWGASVDRLSAFYGEVIEARRAA